MIVSDFVRSHARMLVWYFFVVSVLLSVFKDDNLNTRKWWQNWNPWNLKQNTFTFHYSRRYLELRVALSIIMYCDFICVIMCYGVVSICWRNLFVAVVDSLLFSVGFLFRIFLLLTNNKYSGRTNSIGLIFYQLDPVCDSNSHATSIIHHVNWIGTLSILSTRTVHDCQPGWNILE